MVSVSYMRRDRSAVWRRAPISSLSTACHLTVCSSRAWWKSSPGRLFKPIKVWRCITTHSLTVSHRALHIGAHWSVENVPFHIILSVPYYHLSCVFLSLFASFPLSPFHNEEYPPVSRPTEKVSVPVIDYKLVWTYVTLEVIVSTKTRGLKDIVINLWEL